MILSEKQALALYHLHDSTTKELLYGGAAGGGKSVLGSFFQIQNRVNNEGSVGFIGRKSYKDLVSITIDTTFMWVLQQINESYQCDIKVRHRVDKGILEFNNGSFIYLKDMSHLPQDPEYDRMKVEVMDAWIEEATQVPYKAYKALLPRIRKDLKNGIPKLLITSNPGEGWVKETFIKKKDGTPIVLPQHRVYVPATLYDNPNKSFADNYISSFDDLDEQTRQKFLHGNWDYIEVENPYFYSYNKNSFIPKKYAIQGGERWIISFDFNKSPCTLIVGYVMGIDYAIVDVILSDDTSTEETSLQNVCRKFSEKYILSNIISRYTYTITGDASGNSGNANNNRGFYKDIENYLRIDFNQLTLRKANMSHKDSREQCNRFLQVVNFTIYQSAYPLATEMIKAYAEGDGSLDEAKKKLGLHVSDALRYWIDAALGHKAWRETLNYINLKK